MVVIRFKARVKPETAAEAKAAFEKVVAPSKAVEGVVKFDIAVDVTDPSTIVAIEIFEDRGALERQDALPEAQELMGRFAELLAAPPECTLYEISSSEEMV